MTSKQFMERWDAEEQRGHVLAEQIKAERVPALVRRSAEFDPGMLTAENVIAERRRIDREDPDWWLLTEAARERLIRG